MRDVRTPGDVRAVVEKAYAYATRGDDEDLELLVFEQNAPDTGVQIPKGTVEPGEPPADAAVRELAEESGVENPLGVAHLETDHWLHRRRDVVYRRHFFHVPVRDSRDEWIHEVSGGGVDDSMEFRCYWTCPRSVSLSRNMGRYLESVLE